MKLTELNPCVLRAAKAFSATLVSVLTVSTAQAAAHYQFLKSLPEGESSPVSPLIQASDGALYGTGSGFIFRLNEDGSGYTEYEVEGLYNPYVPKGPLLEGSDGALYGTSSGAVFELNKDGSGYMVLHSFGDVQDDGSLSAGGLIEGNDHALYGTTLYGGAFANPSPFNREIPGYGTVFKLNKDGSGYRVLHSFGGAAEDGHHPVAGLVRGRDGSLYGTTLEGGLYTNGTVFKLNEDGSGYEILHSFRNGHDGDAPIAPLILGHDGVLYGTTEAGGAHGGGTVFKLNRSGSYYRVLHSFGGQFGGGAYPHAGLVQGADGALYGTTLGTVFRLDAEGNDYAVLHVFDANGEAIPFAGLDEVIPLAGLIQGTDGAFYGTTSGNTPNAYSNGGWYKGSVFKLWAPEDARHHRRHQRK